MKNYFYMLLFFCLGYPHLVFSKSTPNVSVDSPIYTYVDKLIAFRLVDNVIYGQRPWSRDEVARIVSVAMENFSLMCDSSLEQGARLKSCTFLKNVLDKLKTEFKEELIHYGSFPEKEKKIHFKYLETAQFNFDYLRSPFRVMPSSHGFGVMDGKVNSLTAYRGGRHFVDGWNWALESTHWAYLSKYLSFYLAPRLEFLVSKDGSIEVSPVINQLYTKFEVGNFELEAGRDSVIWGHSAEGGVLASTNARAFDMIKISNDHPFTLPWYFKYLGYHKYSFFLTNLGPEFTHKNAFMYGFAASLKPTSFLEVGFEHQFTFGGEGSPDYDFLDLISEFFLQRRNGGRHNSVNPGDHRFGLNLRIEIPYLRKTVLYAEGIFEDYGRNSYWAQFTQVMAFQGGIYIPFLTSNGKNSLRLQYEHLPAVYGYSTSWTSGHTLNQLSRGSHWGPQSKTIFATWTHLISLEKILELKLGYISSGNDLFHDDPGGGIDTYSKVQNNPDEHHFLILGYLSHPLKESFYFETMLGYEHILNYNYVNGDDQNNVLVGVHLKYKN